MRHPPDNDRGLGRAEPPARRGERLAWRRALIALASTGGLVAGIALTGGAGATPDRAEAASALPNIVMIVSDDQTRTLNREVMPKTHALIARKGTRFTEAIATTPLCCPSRATMLTGQYAHNHGAVSNRAGYGAMVDKPSVLPEWLREAGYHTAHLGKFLNGFPGKSAPKETVAPGWDEWYTLQTPRRYYDYVLSTNGTAQKYGRDDAEHLTRVLNTRAARVIRQSAPDDAPFYLQLDHLAPHVESGFSRRGRCSGAAVPAPNDEELFVDEPLPKPPGYNEEDVSDKPSFVQGFERLKRKERAAIRQRYRCSLASLRAVDRGVKKIVRTLKDVDELDRTVIVYVSDNGYFFGEHRIRVNKTLPYEEALRVPLAIRVPARYRDFAPRVPVSDAPVANIDLAPTILEWAGAAPCVGDECRTLDGRSLAGLLAGEEPEWAGGRPLLVEFGSGEDRDRTLGVCGYQGVRLRGEILIDYTSVDDGTGACQAAEERELYDLAADPYQLDNAYPPTPGTPAEASATRLGGLLERLGDCTGVEGRDPEPPDGRSYCE